VIPSIDLVSDLQREGGREGGQGSGGEGEERRSDLKETEIVILKESICWPSAVKTSQLEHDLGTIAELLKRIGAPVRMRMGGVTK
jgi:hypothetical protein